MGSYAIHSFVDVDGVVNYTIVVCPPAAAGGAVAIVVWLPQYDGRKQWQLLHGCCALMLHDVIRVAHVSIKSNTSATSSGR